MLRWHQGFLVAVLTPRLRGGPGRGEMALRGKPGDKGRCGFLGGARSARPDGKAVRTPRHSISTTWVDDDPVAYRGHALVEPLV